jgi:Ni,Fe-hydrogenase maturation factor
MMVMSEVEEEFKEFTRKAVERYPELKDLYKVADEVVKKYPEMADALHKWKMVAYGLSRTARSCDYVGLIDLAPELGEASRKAAREGVKKMKPEDLDSFIVNSVEKEVDFIHNKIVEILRKVCGCKPREWPPVEGEI